MDVTCLSCFRSHVKCEVSIAALNPSRRLCLVYVFFLLPPSRPARHAITPLSVRGLCAYLGLWMPLCSFVSDPCPPKFHARLPTTDMYSFSPSLPPRPSYVSPNRNPYHAGVANGSACDAYRTPAPAVGPRNPRSMKWVANSTAATATATAEAGEEG